MTDRHYWNTNGTLAVATSLFFAATALAQESVQPPESEPVGEREDSWYARADVWFASLSGESRFGGSGSSLFSVDGDTGLDDGESSFLGEVGWERDRWLIFANLFDTSAEADVTLVSPLTLNGTLVGAGTQVNSEFGATNAAIYVGYDFFDNLLKGADRTQLRLYGILGSRAIDLNHRVSPSGSSAVEYNDWNAALEGGVRLSVTTDPGDSGDTIWDVGVTVTTGFPLVGDADLSTIGVDFTINWFVNENIGFTFGYHQLDFDVDGENTSDAYEFDGRLAGLLVGVNIKF